MFEKAQIVTPKWHNAILEGLDIARAQFDKGIRAQG